MRKMLGASADGAARAAGASAPARRRRSFDLQALIAAAEAEPPMQVYSNTGKIVEQAEAFIEEYGIQATGTKANAAAQLEMVIREARPATSRAT